MVIHEAIAILGVLTFAVGLNLELVRRASYEVLFRHACFLYVRNRALGSGEARSRHAVFELFESALGLRKTRSIFVGLHLSEEKAKDGVEGVVWYRFPSFYVIPGKKNHYEVTERCRFYF